MIKITNPPVVPELTYNGLHSCIYSIFIAKEGKDKDKYNVQANGQLYSVDGEDKVFLSQEEGGISSVSERDFATTFAGYCIVNGHATDPADFMAKMAASEAAMGTAVADGTITPMDLMALQKIIIGMVHDVAGNVGFNAGV